MSETPDQPKTMTLSAEPRDNRFVRLEPLCDAHREGLAAATAADTEVWRELYPISWDPDHFDASWDQLRDVQAKGLWMPFAVIANGEVVGMTSYLNIDAGQFSVEVGGTYYAPAARGGPVNPAAKRLMMGHAFDDCGARRVVYRVDAINARSRAAVTKLGAVQEGILRHERMTWTGRLRDTVVFSVLAGEWPAVRARLDDRLAAFG